MKKVPKEKKLQNSNPQTIAPEAVFCYTRPVMEQVLFKRISALFLTALVLGASFLVSPLLVRGAESCMSFDLSASRSDAELRQLLAICEKESAETQAQLTAQRAKSSSLAGDVALLDSLIKKAAQQIEIKNKIIKQLGHQINEKEDKIEDLSQKLNREQMSLAQILRKKQEIDQMTFAELMLSGKSVSDFFIDVDNFEVLNESLQDSLHHVRSVRYDTTVEKKTLEEKKTEQANLRNQIEADKKKTEVQKGEKNTLLATSKAEEQNYQTLLAQKQAQASKIRAKLFELAGSITPSGGIPFGDAYNYAKKASQATGVQAAFILAVLKQESGIGKNVGGCIVSDMKSGAGYRMSTNEQIAAVMSPRSLVPFTRILERLGISSNLNTPVSCPIKQGGGYYGYGGAMGPSQFIPSTWELYDDKIEAALDVPVANPWNPQHAITATALYMRDLGAQNVSAQRDAACKYYSGRGCSDPNVVNAFYGNAVMALKTQIQADIDVIEAAN